MFFKNKFQADRKAKDNSTYLIVGLGNVGAEYNMSRHNAGFILLDEIARRENLYFKRSKFAADIADFRYNGNKLILAKPTTLMNRSGLAVRLLLDYYKVDLNNLLIVYDDVDIDLGTVRIRAKGSAGSHNGMKSVINSVNSTKFPRLRIGTGPKHEHMDMVSFVLGKFTDEELKLINKAVDEGIEAIKTFIDQDVYEAMNEHNQH